MGVLIHKALVLIEIVAGIIYIYILDNKKTITSLIKLFLDKSV